MTRLPHTYCLVVVFVLATIIVSPAAGQQVLAGLDLLATDPSLTQLTFGSPAVPAIPADFFAPGSDPFTGTVAMGGSPLTTTLCPSDDLTAIDTIIERLADAVVPLIGNSDLVPIEIVELSLVSSAPIIVTFGGGSPEQWDVEVKLSQAPQSLGQMSITRTHANGGTFDTDLPVLPILFFTKGIEVRVLDFDAEGLPPVQFISAQDPWEDKPQTPGSCTSNWCPTPGGPLLLSAVNAQHGAYPLCVASATAVGDAVPALEAQLNAHPNPFNPSVAITFSVPVASHVDVLVYDASGRRVARLFAGSVAAGDPRTLTWRGDDDYGDSVSSGLYFVRLVGDGVALTRKVVLLK